MVAGPGVLYGVLDPVLGVNTGVKRVVKGFIWCIKYKINIRKKIPDVIAKWCAAIHMAQPNAGIPCGDDEQIGPLQHVQMYLKMG